MNIPAEILDDRIYFIAPPTYKDRLEAIPGLRYDTKRSRWHAPLSWATCVAARGVLGDALEISEALDQFGWGHQQWVAAIEKIKSGAYGEFDLANADLRPYQKAGAEFLWYARRAILADAMRLGKTAQAINALQATLGGGEPALVICPATVTHTWMRELAKWAPGTTAAIVTGTKAQQAKALDSGADVMIVSWALAAKLSRLQPYGSTKLSDSERKEGPLNEIGFRTVIMDEAHRMKSPATKWTRAAWYLAHRAEYRWALSGTPMTDTPADLWSVMHALAPEEYPTRSTFIDRYCQTSTNWFGALEIGGLEESTKAEFFSFFDSRFLHRSKADVLADLPTDIPSTIEVEMSDVQAKAYKALKKDMIAEIGGEILAATDPLSLRTRLLQTAAATPVVNEENQVTALRMPSAKVTALLELIESMGDEPLVVFAQSRKLIELCSYVMDKAHIPNRMVTGSYTTAERQASIDAFQAGDVQVILLTLGAGSEGIELSRSDTVVFLQRSYRQLENDQATERVFSVEHPRGASIIDIITLDTVEARVHEIAQAKGERLQEILRDPVEWLKEALA